MGLPVNIPLELKDVGEAVLFSLFPDLFPSVFNTWSWSKCGSMSMLRTQAWEEGGVRGPHCSLPKATILILEQDVGDRNTRVAWKSYRLAASEDALEMLCPCAESR